MFEHSVEVRSKRRRQNKLIVNIGGADGGVTFIKILQTVNYIDCLPFEKYDLK